tara:strand:+ start:739 stop:1125 length:387 start_codon:yes stop_codon:yes gene_type:complete
MKVIFSQSSIFDDDIGYIAISADSSYVPIYIDGTLIGHTPFDQPIPLIAGNHFISIHPLSVSRPFRQYGPNDSMKNIYIINSDTVKVHLNTYLLNQESKKRTQEDKYTRYISIGLSALVVWQFWILSG